MLHEVKLEVKMWVEAESFEQALYEASGKINRMRRDKKIPKIHCSHELVSGVAFFGATPFRSGGARQ